MSLTIFASAIAILGISLSINHWRNFKNKEWDQYYPIRAWSRAGIYFCFCYLMSYFSGGMALILNSPIATEAQFQNDNWLIYTACTVSFIVIAYAGVWSYFTPVFERKKNTLMSALFGFLWGSSSGQLFLSIWLFASMIDWPIWAAWIATFTVLSMHQPNWHNIYWDHYIAPEHDTPLTQVIKALGCHIPNLAINLTYLALYDNYFIFVSLQVIACVSAGVGMRFPAPWAAPSTLNLAARTNKKPPRCTGYISEDYKSDPYTPYYPGWKSPNNS
ncbi:MAG: hypothetical protein ACJAYG_002602 [Oceanicoccus sp.]|jgi:hypothetical protein